MKLELDRRIPLRDGVELSADVYRPSEEGRYPVIVARTPYGKNTEDCWRRAQAFVPHGYVFVWVDVRGRGDSDGVFTPYRYEGPDGYDVIEWAAVQEWSDGQVATWGQSYLGAVQLLAAVEHPPSLAAMVVHVTPSDPFVEWPTGVHIPQELSWHRLVQGRALQYVDSIDWQEVYRHLPLATMDERAGFHAVHWREDFAHPATDQEYWAGLAYQERLTTVDVPTIHVTGWYDDVQPGCLINFTLMSQGAPSERTRRAQRLVVGPWDHGLTERKSQALAAVDFGPDADLDLTAFEIRWLDHFLKGEPNGADADARVHHFVMGRNRWETAEEWPLPEARDVSYFLASDGYANTRSGDGRLTDALGEGTAPSDTYTYDPADPVPFLTEPTFGQIGGPEDYAEVEQRQDVLVYTGPTLEEDLQVAGQVRIELFAASDGPDTDFMAKLIDVHPDGVARRICDGMVRARYRSGMTQEIFLTPDEVARFDIDLWSTSHVFRVGHRVRLEIASSAFPKYDRNLNTGESLACGTRMRVATNRVVHDQEWPSRLILPTNPVLGGEEESPV